MQSLEHLNELQADIESMRQEKRTLQSSHASQLQALEAEKARIQSSLDSARRELANKPDDKEQVAKLEADVTELREELASAQDELDDLR